MNRIAILTEHIETGQNVVDQVTRFYHKLGIFPRIDLHQDREIFFNTLLQAMPTGVIILLSGVASLNAAEHLRALLPECGLIWCSDLDFSLHAFRLRAEYFILMPVSETILHDALSVWNERNFHRTGVNIK